MAKWTSLNIPRPLAERIKAMIEAEVILHSNVSQFCIAVLVREVEQREARLNVLSGHVPDPGLPSGDGDGGESDAERLA